MIEKIKKPGICLSGGGALGYAHIGVLQALEDNGIFPDVISGSSMGAIVGGLYAAGLSPAQMLQIIRDEKIYKISTLLNPTFSGIGISTHKTLRLLLKEHIPSDSFENLTKEFYVCVSNLSTASWEMKNTGSLHDYVVASASIPYVFEYQTIDGMVYLDGGLFNNLPSQILQDKCDMIIGVDVLPYYHVCKPRTAKEKLLLPIRAVMHSNSESGRKLCDFLIESPAVHKYTAFSFDKYEEIYKTGYNTTIVYIKNNPEILPK